MARKTHRPDDILWTVTAADLEAVHTNKLAVVKPSKKQETVKMSDAVDISLGEVLDTRYPRKSLVKLFEKIDYEPMEMDLHILYEDDDLLIVDKPAGVTVNSKDQVSLANGVAYYFKEHGIKRKVRFLNRLDRDTTGCIVIAKSGLAQSLYQQQMDDNTFEKWYMATVEGFVEADEASLVLFMERSADGIHYEVNPKGKETRTDYSVLCRHQSQSVDNSVNKSKNSVDIASKNVDIELQNVDKHSANVDKSVHNSRKSGYTEVLVRLYTGKTHQIRVAFSHIGHPLAGDTLYGAQPTGQYFQLRAKKVIFTHMRTGKRITVTA